MDTSRLYRRSPRTEMDYGCSKGCRRCPTRLPKLHSPSERAVSRGIADDAGRPDPLGNRQEHFQAIVEVNESARRLRFAPRLWALTWENLSAKQNGAANAAPLNANR